jgi:hypothetical protein
LDLILQNVENRILSPDLRRLIYVVPFIAGDQIEEASRIFEQAGFDGARYHVESGGNPLNPEYIEALLIPLNPRIPIGAFETLLHDLKSLGDVRQSGLSIPSHNSPESVDHHANKQSIS